MNCKDVEFPFRSIKGVPMKDIKISKDLDADFDFVSVSFRCGRYKYRSCRTDGVWTHYKLPKTVEFICAGRFESQVSVVYRDLVNLRIGRVPYRTRLNERGEWYIPVHHRDAHQAIKALRAKGYKVQFRSVDCFTVE